MKYSYLDYKKSLALLQRLECELEKLNQDYSLCVTNFEEVPHPRSSMEFSEKKDFKTFELIYTFFEVDGDPLISFEMFEGKCVVDMESHYTFSKEERKIFKQILPFKKAEFVSWQAAMACFLDKIGIIVFNKLKTQEK